MNEKSQLPTIAVVGGTGREGSGLAYRWAKAGYSVIIGSRSVDRAARAGQEIRERLGGIVQISGASNLEAATRAEVIMLTVPQAAHAEILASIKPAIEGKLLIDATVPLRRGRPPTYSPPSAGSAAKEASAILGPGVEIAAAFHNISHEHLTGDSAVECDVLVTGTSPGARTRALELVSAAGFRGWDSGPLENASVIEGLTSILIHINRHYGSRHAGIRVTGAENA